MHQNTGTLAIVQSSSIPTVAAKTSSGWVALSDQATSQFTPVPDSDALTILDGGTAASVADLDTAGDGSVVTTSGGNVFQKQHNRWWRLTATWSGDCSATPAADVAADGPALRWAPPPAIRA
jgi:hypothetical protein